MENLIYENLEIEIKENNDSVQIILSGKCIDLDSKKVLSPYFDKIIDSFKDKNKILEFNFINLLLLDSSSIKLIINLLKELNQNRIKSNFIYDKFSRWQAPSFKALKSISIMLPYINIVEN